MSEKKAVIKIADMSEEMQQEAVDCATQALEKYNIEKDIAAYIKKEFDKRYIPPWHAIVGRNFGSYVTHENRLCKGGIELERGRVDDQMEKEPALNPSPSNLESKNLEKKLR